MKPFLNYQPSSADVDWDRLARFQHAMDGVAMKTLFTVGSLLPAVGIAILCKQVVTKPLDWLTFAFGFTLAAVLHCNLIASAIIACFFALINYEIQQAKFGRPAIAASATGDDEEEEDI